MAGAVAECGAEPGAASAWDSCWAAWIFRKRAVKLGVRSIVSAVIVRVVVLAEELLGLEPDSPSLAAVT